MSTTTFRATLSEKEIRLRDVIAGKKALLLADLEQLVAIPTGRNHTQGLDACRGLLMQRLKALGASVELAPGDARPSWLGDAAAGSPAPVAVCERKRQDQPSMLLAGHLDTVFDPAGEFLSMRTSADGSRATGPGVIDMKGGLVVAVAALEALEEVGVSASWTFVLSSDEEMGSFSSESILREQAKRHEVGLIFEPALPGGALAVQRMGSGQFMIEARGRAAHVGRAFKDGVSAVTALAEAITRVSSQADPDRGVLINIGPLEGGGATNIVPDRARAWGNFRFATPELANEIEVMLKSVQSNLAQLESDEPVKTPAVVVQSAVNRPAKPLTPDVQRLADVARGAAASLDQQLPFETTGGVCDGNILHDEGLPTIDTLGVRGGGMHTTEEWIQCASLVERCQLAAVLMARLSEGRFGGTSAP